MLDCAGKHAYAHMHVTYMYTSRYHATALWAARVAAMRNAEYE